MRKLPFLLFIILLVGLLAACEAKPSSTAYLVPEPPPPPVCTWTLSIAVTHGPDAGLLEQGHVILQGGAPGNFTGVLPQTTGPSVKMVGQITGQAIAMTFDVGNNQALAGAGLLPGDFGDCQGTVVGPLLGPREGDSGQWTLVALQGPALM